MKYTKAKYKYQLSEDITQELPEIFPVFSDDYFSCDSKILKIFKGYAWDGASGPTIDTKNSMEASLVHDCLYQAIRLGVLDRYYKVKADKIFYRILRKHGMCVVRAVVWFLGVYLFGGGSCKKGKLSGRDVSLSD